MSNMSFDLTSLLSPYAPEAFFADFWEQRYLFIKRDQPRYYESLITAADLENIISNSDARYPAHAAHANVYITPGNAKGFTPHYDVHEVFVLQIAGRKRWQLYEPVIPLPHRTQLFRPELYTGQPPMAEVDLNVGDLLYLPRGVLHSTTTAESFSAHVTIGISVYTWADLLKELLSSAIDEEDMRRALPPGFATDRELRRLLNRQMGDMWEKLRPQPDDDKVIERFTSRVLAAQIRRPPPFRADVTLIDLNSRLQAPSPDSYRITQEGEKTMLEFKDTRYQMPVPVASTMRAISQLRSFRPADLAGPLNAEGVLTLTRHLVDIGFLTSIPADQGCRNG